MMRQEGQAACATNSFPKWHLRDGRQRLLRALASNDSSTVLSKASSILAAECITLFVDFHSELPWLGKTYAQRGGHLYVRMLRPVPKGRIAECSGAASARLDCLLCPASLPRSPGVCCGARRPSASGNAAMQRRGKLTVRKGPCSPVYGSATFEGVNLPVALPQHVARSP